MLTEFLVRDYSLKVGILAFIGISLTSEQVCELLESNRVLALVHKLSNKLDVVHFLGNTHGFRVSLELTVDV